MSRVPALELGVAVVAACCVMLVLSALPARAVVENAGGQTEDWHFTTGFSATVNPKGAWSWGQSDAKGTLGSFDIFPHHSRTPGEGVPFWTVAGGDGFHDPCIGLNTTEHLRNGVRPGEIAFHPGPDRRLAVVRWTSPRSGLVLIRGCFGEGDYGKVDVYVLKTDGDGKATEVLFKALNTASDEPFKLTTKVLEGETIDFVVGNAGDWTGDSTPLAATVVLEPDPVSGSK